MTVHPPGKKVLKELRKHYRSFFLLSIIKIISKSSLSRAVITKANVFGKTRIGFDCDLQRTVGK